MSSLTLGFDHDDDGADRRELVAGEPNSDGLTRARRIDLWYFGG